MIEQQLEHMDNGIRAQVSRAQKTAARKKLYFALSIAFGYAWSRYKECAAALASEASKLDEEGEQRTNIVIPSLMMAESDALRAIYCVAASCQDYKNAFGEYPEFVRFLGRDSKEDAAAEVLGAVMSLPGVSRNLWASIGKRIGIPGEPPDLTKKAFGTDFLNACEGVKLKGEV